MKSVNSLPAGLNYWEEVDFGHSLPFTSSRFWSSSPDGVWYFFFFFWKKSHGGLHAFPSCADRCWDIQFVNSRCELYMKIAFRYSAIFEDSSPWCSGKYTAINCFYRYCIFNRLHLKTCSNKKKLSAWLDIRKGKQKIKRHLKMISWPLNNF